MPTARTDVVQATPNFTPMIDVMLVLGIDRLGRLYLDRRPLDRESLAAALRSSYASSPGERVLYIRADRDVGYGVVEDALHLARESGAAVVGLISELPPSKRGAR